MEEAEFKKLKDIKEIKTEETAVPIEINTVPKLDDYISFLEELRFEILNTITSTENLIPEVDNLNLRPTFYIITAQAIAITIANSNFTPISGQKLIIRIKDNGTARAISFGTQYRAGTDVALPTTTVLNKTLYMGFIWNSADLKWDILAKSNGF